MSTVIKNMFSMLLEIFLIFTIVRRVLFALTIVCTNLTVR